jgi:hypothetical protein
MSLSTELRQLADLLVDAAGTIAQGIEGSYADEEDQHPMAKSMRRVERRCRKKAAELERMAKAGEAP